MLSDDQRNDLVRGGEEGVKERREIEELRSMEGGDWRCHSLSCSPVELSWPTVLRFSAQESSQPK